MVSREAVTGAVGTVANLWRTEPAACTAVLVSGLAVLTEFGLPITETKQAVVVALLTAAGGLLVRARVTPVARPAVTVAVPVEPVLEPEPLAP